MRTSGSTRFMELVRSCHPEVCSTREETLGQDNLRAPSGMMDLRHWITRRSRSIGHIMMHMRKGIWANWRKTNSLQSTSEKCPWGPVVSDLLKTSSKLKCDRLIWFIGNSRDFPMLIIWTIFRSQAREWVVLSRWVSQVMTRLWRRDLVRAQPRQAISWGAVVVKEFSGPVSVAGTIVEWEILMATPTLKQLLHFKTITLIKVSRADHRWVRRSRLARVRVGYIACRSRYRGARSSLTSLWGCGTPLIVTTMLCP